MLAGADSSSPFRAMQNAYLQTASPVSQSASVTSGYDPNSVLGGMSPPLDRRCNLGYLPPPAPRGGAKNFPGPWQNSERVEASNTPSLAEQNPIYFYHPQNEIPASLEQRLDDCPILRDHIIWEEADGTRIPYTEWESEKKQRLEEIFFKLANDEPDLGLDCPDPTHSHPATHNRMYLTAEQAFDVFAAHVAHVLFVEARHMVPWSVAQSSNGELDQLLASYNYQSIIRPSGESNYPTGIEPARDYQQTTASDATSALLCDPRVGYRFMTGTLAEHRYQRSNLVGPSEEQTLINLTYFFRKNVAHGGGESLEQLDQRSLLKDRLKLEESNMIWATAGCHGAAQLFQDLARSINIPLLNIGTQTDPDTSGHYGNRTHRGLIYEWESPRTRILWHTDEIYAMAYFDPVFPIDETGQPLSLAASQRQFFNRFWVRPATLQAWGFVYRPHMVYPEVGFGVSSRGRHEDYADFGWMGGYWQRSDRLETHFAAGGIWDEMSRYMNGDLSSQYHLENLYQNCSWDLVSQYAQYGAVSRPAFDIYIQNRYAGRSRTGLPVRQFRSLDEYWNRAVTCVDAYGGPNRVRELHAEWESGRGFPGTAMGAAGM